MRKLTGLMAGGIVALAIGVAAQTNGTPERFTAMAVNMNRGGAGTVDIAITRWSTDAERDRLMTTLMEQGADKLLAVLQDMPRVGYIRQNGGLGYDLHYARRVPGEDGGERVVIATDRRISFWEAASRPRSIDYPFTLIELRLNADGQGEGKISVAAKITADAENKIVTIENYDMQPVMLQSVKRQRSK